MTTFFYWSGVAVWAVIAGLFVWQVVIELFVVGVATSISWHRWAMRSPTSSFKWRKHTLGLLRSVAVKSYEYWGYRNNGRLQTSMGTGATWRGIGDWEMPTKQPEGVAE